MDPKLFSPPDISPAMLDRPPLMQLIEEAAANRFVYVCAPAGYGKTVSVSQWLALKGARSAWVALDRFDNEQGSFYRKIASALTALQPNNAFLRDATEHLAFYSEPSKYAARAISEFEPDDRRYYLVIDDLHIIDETDILQSIPSLLSRMPENITTLLVSRSTPSACFSGMFVKNNMVITEADRLLFNIREIRLLFKKRGSSLTMQEAEKIYEATGGWAAAVNSFAVSNSYSLDNKLIRQHLDTFLEEEIWSSLDPELCDFMLRSSILPEMTPDRCRVITEFEDSAELLERLYKKNIFINKINGNTYCFFDLYREFLENKLELDSPELLSELLRKAAGWYGAQGEYSEAARYYRKCGDYRGMANSFFAENVQSAGSADVAEKIDFINSLDIEKLPENILTANPRFLTELALFSYLDGRIRDMWYYLDILAPLHREVIEYFPELIDSLNYLTLLDVRENINELPERRIPRRVPRTINSPVTVPTVTLNLPYVHRSLRDFSLYAGNPEVLPHLRETIGSIIGEAYDPAEDCMIAGILLEQNKPEEALRYALSADSKLRTKHPAELKLCSMLILADALAAAGYDNESRNMISSASKMIEDEKANYLKANFSAYMLRRNLTSGGTNTAARWLRENPEDTGSKLSLYKIYRYFTTVKAYLATGKPDAARLLAQRLLDFSRDYDRPLDMIEAHVLLAAALAESGKRSSAVNEIRQAVLLAQRYDFKRIFHDEGALVADLLGTLVRRADQGGEDRMDRGFAKSCHLLACSKVKPSSAGPVSKANTPARLSEKQLHVMKLIADGMSYTRISEVMGLKYTTIRTHAKAAFDKLNVSNAADAVRKSREYFNEAEM